MRVLVGVLTPSHVVVFGTICMRVNISTTVVDRVVELMLHGMGARGKTNPKIGSFVVWVSFGMLLWVVYAVWILGFISAWRNKLTRCLEGMHAIWFLQRYILVPLGGGFENF